MNLTATAVDRPDGAGRSAPVVRLLPWLVVCVWLIGAIVAFWCFEFPLQGPYGDAAWCAAAGNNNVSEGHIQ